jgi:NAD+ synthase
MKFDAKKITAEMIEWTRAWFEEQGTASMAIVGISGGKDSSVTAAICAKALGKSRVFGILLPQGEQHDVDCAEALVEYLGIPSIRLGIESIVDECLEQLELTGVRPNYRCTSNLPARIRMTMLYAIAAMYDGRVVNTSNLSEGYVGYCTKFGDNTGDVGLLADFTVTEIKMIGRELGLPEALIEKAPEDGLSGKTDEENLGFTYEELDRFIREGVELIPERMRRVERLRAENFHKSRPMPKFTYEGIAE